MRYILFAVGIPLALWAPPAQSVQPPSVGLPSGCNARNLAQVGPYYLAVNDPCLGSNAAVGDGASPPGSFWMNAGSPNLYIAATASLDVTASITAGSPTLTIAPCLFRAEWGGPGPIFRIQVPGAGTSATIATATTPTLINGTVLTVASGGTAAAVGDVITDDPSSPGSGAIPAGTVVIANTATSITLSQQVTAQINTATTITYYAALANSAVNAVAGGGCSATLSGNAVSTIASLPITLAVTANSQSFGSGTTTISNGSYTQWRHTPVTLAGNQLTINTYQAGVQGAFFPERDVTLGTSLWAVGTQRTTVVIHSPSGVCPDQVARIVLSTATAATLDRSLPCALTTGAPADIYWGTLVASPSYNGNLTLSAGTSSIAESIEVQGSGTASTATAPVPLDTTVASVTDYLRVVLAANAVVSSPVYPINARMLWGHDDANAVLGAACQVASNPANLTHCPAYTSSTAINQGYRGLYWPPGVQTFMFSVGTTQVQVVPTPVGAVDPLMQVAKYGEAGIIWPRQADWYFNTSPIDGQRWVPNQTLFATQSLIQARAAVAAGSCATFGSNGDSWLVPGINGDGYQSSPVGALVDAIDDQNGICPPNFEHYEIGGVTAAGMDVLGANVSGFGAGIPDNPANAPDFYQPATTQTVSAAPASGSPTLTFASSAIAANFFPGETLTDATTSGVIPTGTFIKSVSGATVTMSTNATANGTSSDSISGSMASSQWMTIMMTAPKPVDAWIFREGINDSINLSVASLEDDLGYTQQPLWNQISGRYPDWAFMPGTNPPLGTSLQTFQGQLVDAGLERSMALSGYFSAIMHNGGTVGYVDAARVTGAAEEGWDPVDLAATAAPWVLPSVGAAVAAQNGFPFYFFEPVLGFSAQIKIQQSGSLSAATFYGNFANGVCARVGAGSQFTPGNTAGQTGTSDTYSGGAFCIDRDPTTGNLKVFRYVYRVVKTGNTCTYTASTGVLACLAAITNMGFSGGIGFTGSTPKTTAAAAWICGVGIGTSTGPAFMGAPTNCIQAAIAAGGVSINGRNITLASTGIGSTVAGETVSVMLYRLQPGDPTDTGCQPRLGTGGATVETIAMTVDPVGRVSFSDVPLNSQFEEQNYGCQWQGYMAGFFGAKYYPEIFAEDNASHAVAFIISNGINGGNFQEYQPWTSRLTPSMTTAESWGMLNYVGPYFGAGYGHTGGNGARNLYGAQFRVQDWRTK